MEVDNEAMSDSKKAKKRAVHRNSAGVDPAKTEFLRAFGLHIKKIRQIQGFSQDRVYLEGSLSRATMSRIEHGHVDAQIWTLQRIADTIGVPLRRLVDFEPK